MQLTIVSGCGEEDSVLYRSDESFLLRFTSFTFELSLQTVGRYLNIYYVTIHWSISLHEHKSGKYNVI